MKHRGRPALVFLIVVSLLFISQMKFSNQVRHPRILPSFHLSQLVKQHHWNEKCKPQLQVAFAKTHKTGSSTLQNIIFRWHAYLRIRKGNESLLLNILLHCPFLSTFYLVRHGQQHNSVFALPKKSHVFSYKEPFKASMLRYWFCTEHDKTLNKMSSLFCSCSNMSASLPDIFASHRWKYSYVHVMFWIWVILKCWGNSSMVCQQNSDAL